MGGEHHTRVGLLEVSEQTDEGQAARERQGGLRLVQDPEALHLGPSRHEVQE